MAEEGAAVVKLRIVSPTHGVVSVHVSEDETGLVLKEKALQRFCTTKSFIFKSIEAGKDDAIISSFKLIRAKTKSPVKETEMIRDMKLSQYEEILLVVKCPSFKDPLAKVNLAAPTKLQILEKTAFVSKSTHYHPIYKVNDLLEQDDMRKIFVTLAQECAHILALSPSSNKLISYYRQRIHYYIKNHENAERVMVDLGFPLDKVKKAMKLKANNTRATLDWLIDNVEPGKVNELRRSSRPSVGSARRESILSTSFTPSDNTVSRIEGLLEIVKFYAEKDELVYQSNINEMILIGYDADLSREALRLTRNNVGAAIAHINGDENPSITELRDGLSLSSTIRQKFLSSPQIQDSLKKPQNFALFIGILDNPAQAQAWNPFSQTGALMTHIIVTYHEEKHTSAVNQFNDSRLPISALSAPN